MRRFQFLANPTMFNDPDAFVGHIGRVNGKKELCRELSLHLQLPDYFGCNWDALEECLCDFHWVSQFKVILIHDDMFELETKDFHLYIKILLYALNSWKNGDPHQLEVIFPSKYENILHPYEEKYLKVVEESIKNGFW